MYSPTSRSYSAIPSASATSTDCSSATGWAVCIARRSGLAIDGVDPLEGEVLGEVPGLVLPGLRQLGVGRAVEPLDALGQGVADEQQLH